MVRRQQSRHQPAVVASAESDGQVDALVYQIYKSIIGGTFPEISGHLLMN